MPERRRADSFTSSHNPPSEWSQRAPSIGEEEASPGQGAWRRWLALRGGGACELRRLPLGGNPDAALPAQPSSFFAMPLQPLDLSKLVSQRTRTHILGEWSISVLSSACTRKWCTFSTKISETVSMVQTDRIHIVI